MTCPSCNSEIHCGCEACRIFAPDLPNKMIIHRKADVTDDWDEECPVCGRTESIHWWFNYQLNDLDKP